MAGANRDLIERYAPSASIVTTQNIPSIVEAVTASASGSRQTDDREEHRGDGWIILPTSAESYPGYRSTTAA